MTWGLTNRLSRIIRPTDGHTVMLAVDHGYFLGPTRRLEVPRKTIEPLLPYADALMITRGVVRTSIDPGSNVPVVLRVSGGASVLKEDLSHEDVTTSMEEAVRLNASAVALSIFVGAPHEHESLVNLGELVNQGGAFRSLDDTLGAAWRLLAPFPADALTRIPRAIVERHRPSGGAA